jgi:hypothetical protein
MENLLIPTQLTQFRKREKTTKWYPKEKIFTNLLGCVECSMGHLKKFIVGGH